MPDDKPFTPVTGDRMPKTGLGLPQDIACAACYALTWLSGFGFFLLERRDPLVRFHAALSVLFFVPIQLFLLGFYAILALAAPTTVWVKFVVWTIYGLLLTAVVVLWVLLLVRAYRCWKPEIPVLSRLADRLVEITTPEEEIK